MARLNGRASIMRYLGHNPHNTKRWRQVQARYKSLLYWDADVARWWALSEELDRLDRCRATLQLQQLLPGKLPTS